MVGTGTRQHAGGRPPAELADLAVGLDAGASRRRLGQVIAVVGAILVTPGVVWASQSWGVEVPPPVLFVVAVIAAVAVVVWGYLDERQRAELRHLAHYDPLTGLANRRAFQEVVDRVLAGRAERGSRAGDQVAFLFVDLDGFKGVNDTLGHDAGDEVLVTVAHRLREAVRGGDLVARLGGDEFVVFCPNCSDNDALDVADRVHVAVGDPIDLGDTWVQVTASVGVVAGDPGSHAGELLARADAAMYQAKHAGKDCTVVDRAA